MRQVLSLFALVLLSHGSASAQAISKEQLREQLIMPSQWLEIDQSISTRPSKDQATAKISELTKRAKGDARDADLLLELADNQDILEKTKDAETLRKKAAGLFLVRIEQEPKNGWLLVQYSNCLAPEQRKPFVDKALALSPNDYRCVLALAELRFADLWSVILTPQQLSERERVSFYALEASLPLSVTQEQLAKMKAIIQDGYRLMDRAQQLAPRELEVARFRHNHRLAFNMLIAAALSRSGESGANLALTIYDDALMQDVDRLYALENENILQIACLSFHAAFVRSMVEGDTPLWRKKMSDAVERLQELKLRADATQAGTISRWIGLLYYCAGDYSKAHANAREALARNPDDPVAPTLFIATMEERKEDFKLVEPYLLRHPSAKNSYTIAKGRYSLYNDSDGMAKHLKAGLALDPNDYHCNLGMASHLLKTRDDKASLQEAERFIAKAESQLNEQSSAEQRIEVGVIRAIAMCLGGNYAQAYSLLDRLQRTKPDDEKIASLKVLIEPVVSR